MLRWWRGRRAYRTAERIVYAAWLRLSVVKTCGRCSGSGVMGVDNVICAACTGAGIVRVPPINPEQPS